jgi:hypothetical protein
VAEYWFDAQKLIVFSRGDSSAERAGFDLAAVRRHGEVRDGRVLGFAGAVGKDGGAFVRLREGDRLERFGQRADLIHLHENPVGGAGINAFLMNTRLPPLRQRACAGIDGVLPEQLFDAKKLVVFREAVAPT